MTASVYMDAFAGMRPVLARVVPELAGYYRDLRVVIGSAAATLAGARVTLAEQIRVLESFGSPKDLQRAALLKQQDGVKR